MGTRAIALLVGLGAAGAAVAGGSGGSAQRDRHVLVERTVRAAVYAAVRHHNHRRACRFGTSRGRQRLLEGFNSSSGPDFPLLPPSSRMRSQNYPATVRRLRRNLVVEVLRASPTRARVQVAEGTGRFDGSGYITLVTVEGRWRLDNSNLIPYGD